MQSVLDELFTLRVYTTEGAQDKALVHHKLRCNNVQLTKSLKKLHYKIGDMIDYERYMSDVYTQCL